MRAGLLNRRVRVGGVALERKSGVTLVLWLELATKKWGVMVEAVLVCGDCGWETSNADGEEDAHSQAYLHAEGTGHTPAWIAE